MEYRPTVKPTKPKARKFWVIRWIDPFTGKWCQESTKSKRKREANEAVRAKEDELIRLWENGRHTAWDEFTERYSAEKVCHWKKTSRINWGGTQSLVEERIKPELLLDVSSKAISELSADLLAEGMRPTTIQSHLSRLRAALRWAERMDMITKSPHIEPIKHARGKSKLARSRPINLEEFERVIMATEKERPTDFEGWQRLLWGLWHSGMRVSELLELAWDGRSRFMLDERTARFPLIRIRGDGEKGQKDRFQAVTPEFWDLVKGVRRDGYVFPLPGRKGDQMTAKRVIRVIGFIGKRAKVVVSDEGDSVKYASSHDIGRRAFTMRIAAALSQPADVQKWMRHQSFETTAKYYYLPEAVDLAAKVWPEHIVSDVLGDTALSEAEANDKD